MGSWRIGHDWATALKWTPTTDVTDTYPGFRVTNTAQDIFIRISFPSSTNLQDIIVFIIKTTAFCKPKYLKTTKEFAKFPETVLQLNPNRTCWGRGVKKNSRKGKKRFFMSNQELCWDSDLFDHVWWCIFSSGHRTGKSQFSFQSQRKAMPKNAQTTAQLHSSHTLVK